jgi:hypothetical protein
LKSLTADIKFLKNLYEKAIGEEKSQNVADIIKPSMVHTSHGRVSQLRIGAWLAFKHGIQEEILRTLTIHRLYTHAYVIKTKFLF